MREKIFSELCASKNQFISGGKIADKYGISRVAVWKHISALKEMGYQIESVRNKGYLLLNQENILSKTDVLKYLKTEFIGRNLMYYPETNSTNQTLKELLISQELPEGSTVIAQKQNQGRGRRGKKWESPNGGLWFSVMLLPKLTIRQAPLLSLVFAVALARALEEIMHLPTTIKWPNDIFCAGKKISGILLELRGELDTIEYLICGIGINVNIAHKSFTPELFGKATSMYIEKGIYFSLAEVLGITLNNMELYYNKFLTYGLGSILEEFKSKCWHLGKTVRIQVNDEIVEGVNTDIDIFGNLKIKLDENIKVVTTGDLEVL